MNNTYSQEGRGSNAEPTAPLSVAVEQLANRVDIKAFIDERPISALQWFLVAMCFLVVVADGMDGAIMGIPSPWI